MGRTQSICKGQVKLGGKTLQFAGALYIQTFMKNTVTNGNYNTVRSKEKCQYINTANISNVFFKLSEIMK
jgi:hypothetical protein